MMDKNKAKQIADAHNIIKYRKDGYDNVIRQIDGKIESEANKGQYKTVIHIEGSYELFEDVCCHYDKRGFHIGVPPYGVRRESGNCIHVMVLNWGY